MNYNLWAHPTRTDDRPPSPSGNGYLPIPTSSRPISPWGWDEYGRRWPEESIPLFGSPGLDARPLKKEPLPPLKSPPPLLKTPTPRLPRPLTPTVLSLRDKVISPPCPFPIHPVPPPVVATPPPPPMRTPTPMVKSEWTTGIWSPTPSERGLLKSRVVVGNPFLPPAIPEYSESGTPPLGRPPFQEHTHRPLPPPPLVGANGLPISPSPSDSLLSSSEREDLEKALNQALVEVTECVYCLFNHTTHLFN